jgi:hypothetical protein
VFSVRPSPHIAESHEHSHGCAGIARGIDLSNESAKLIFPFERKVARLAVRIEELGVVTPTGNEIRIEHWPTDMFDSASTWLLVSSIEGSGHALRCRPLVQASRSQKRCEGKEQRLGTPNTDLSLMRLHGIPFPASRRG